MKRDKTDDIFSKYIRARDHYTCQKCGKVYEPNSAGLHCSHIFSRRHRTIRWDERNAKALCFPCHQWYGSNPIESGKWAETYLTERYGPDGLAEIKRIKDSGVKLYKSDIEQIYRELKQKLEALNDHPI